MSDKHRFVKDWFKATLAFVLATTFILSPWASWIQSRTFGNVILVTVIQSPAKTVGNFLDSSFLLLITTGLSGAIFAFMQAVSGDSYVGLAFILFLVTYTFATLRTVNIARYFVASLIGPIFAFTACTSLVGVAGRNSSGGSQFDYNFLTSTINSYLIGLAICFIINILVFPDFAEPHINEQIVSVLRNISDLSSSILSCMSGAETVKEAFSEGHQARVKLVAEIQSQFRVIDTNIAQAAAEVSFSYFSIKSYSRIVKGCKSIASVLFSLQTTLGSASAQQLLASEEFANHIAPKMQSTWIKLDSACRLLFEEITHEMNGHKSKAPRNSETNLEKALENSTQVTEDALLEFESHNPSVFLNLFSEKDHVASGVLTAEVKSSWGKLLQATFFILGSKEIAKELTSLHSTICAINKKRKVRLHLRHFLPSGIFRRIPSPKGDEAEVVTFRMRLGAIKDFLLSSNSIFGLKCAIALVCLQMILFNRPDIFKQWYLTASVTSLLVAISPSMGQTLLGLPIQIVGSSLGAIIGYAGVIACGKTSYGLVGFAALVAIPGYYLQLKSMQTFVFGLLMLMAFSTYVSVSSANAINPAFDKPELYLGKTIGTLAISLSFAVVFSLVLYPTLARDVLRTKMFEVFKELNIFYRKIIVSTVNVPEGVLTIEQDEDVKDTRNQILTKLLAIDTILVFASVEPKLEARFETAKYKAVLESQHHLLDRIDCLRLSAGDKPFHPDVRKWLNSGNIGKVRVEMQTTFRLLLYVYASTMLTTQRIPPGLPRATEVRNRLAEEFVLTVMKHYHGLSAPGEELEGIIPNDEKSLLSTLSQEKWMRLLSFSASAREVAEEMDRITPQMVAIFGEFPDLLTHVNQEEEDSVVEENEWLI